MFIGLDVHKDFIQVAKIKDASSPVEESFKFDTNEVEIVKFAKKLKSKDKVVMENCTNTIAIARIFLKHGVNITMSNPIKTKMIAESKIKTDKVDAEALARLLASGYLPTVWIPPEEIEELRKLVAFFGSVVLQRTIIKNRINSVLARNLVEYSHLKSGLFGKIGRKFLKEVKLPEDEKHRLNLEIEILNFMDKQIEKIKNRMAQKAHADEEVKRIMSIPGFDYISALYIKASIGDIERFKSAKKLVSYFGLNPRVYQSGKSCYVGSISKQGSLSTRFTLVQAAHMAVITRGPLRAFFMRVKRRSCKNKAIVAVASKMARLIWVMYTKKTNYLFAPPLRYKEKLARLRILATGVKMHRALRKGEISQGGKKTYLQLRKSDHDNAIIGEQVYENEINKRSGNMVEIA